MKKLLLLLVLMCFPNIHFSQDFNWMAQSGGINNDIGNALILDNLGNSYSVGSFKSTPADFDPSDQTFNLSSNGINDIYIQKLDVNGSLVWAKSIGGLSNEGANDIAIDSNNDIYITGFFTGTVDFDPGAGEFNLTSTSTSTNTFILKLNSDGEFLWVRQLTGDTNQGISIAIDSNNNVYTTGSFILQVDFDPSNSTHNLVSLGSFDFYIQKMDSDGNFFWARSYGGDSAGSSDLSRSITSDGNNNVLVTGQFQNTIDFDSSSNEYELTSNGIRDIFILKLDTNGNFVWARNIGGVESDSGSTLISDNLNNIYVTGSFRETVDFDPSSEVFNISSHPDDQLGDIFILKLNSNGDFLWAHGYGGEGKDEGESLATDNLGNLYVLSQFKFTVDFDPSNNLEELSTFNNDAFSDVSIQKFDSDGNLDWVRVYGGPNDDYGSSIKLNNSNLYITGRFDNVVDFDPNSATFEVTTFGLDDAYVLSLSENTLSVSNQVEININLYPNPTSRFIKIQSPLKIDNAQVFSSLGKHFTVNLSDKTIDLGSLSDGIYFLKLKINQSFIIKKIILGKQ